MSEEFKEPRSLKMCSSCGWAGYTSLIFCHRKQFHHESIRMTVVPAEQEAAVLENTVVVRI